MDQRSREPLPGTSEVAEYFGYSNQDIYDQRYRGVGVGTLGFKIGKRLVFRWEDIDRYVDEHAQAGRKAA